MGWRFNGKDYQWLVADQPPIASIALQLTENGTVITSCFSAGYRDWQVGIAEQFSDWEAPADGGFNTKASHALDLIKLKSEDDVLDATLRYISTLSDRLKARWQLIAGDTDPDTSGFESAVEAVTALVNRDMLPPPNEL